MICKECGARIEDDAPECKFCGAQYGSPAPVAEPEQPAEVPEETVQTTVAQEETYGAVSEEAAIEEILDENEIKRRNQMEKIRAEKQSQLEEIEHRRKIRKRKQRRNVLLVVILVFLIGAAVAAGVYYLSPSYTSDGGDDIVIVTQPPTEEPEVTKEPEETSTPEPETTQEPTTAPTQEPEAVTATETPVVSYATPMPTEKTVTVKPSATKKPTAVQTGITKTLKSATITGGEVIKANGKSYMSFIYNNKWYYAKVSDNTTTKFIAWKKMLVNAYTKGETYNGVPVFTITKITHLDESKPTASQSQTAQTNGYIISDSSTRIITESELQGMSIRDLRRARNEIYARHGRTFNDDSLQSYFNSCSWYKPNSNYNYANENANLNEIEKQNIITIRNYEKR